MFELNITNIESTKFLRPPYPPPYPTLTSLNPPFPTFPNTYLSHFNVIKNWIKLGQARNDRKNLPASSDEIPNIPNVFLRSSAPNVLQLLNWMYLGLQGVTLITLTQRMHWRKQCQLEISDQSKTRTERVFPRKWKTYQCPSGGS